MIPLIMAAISMAQKKAQNENNELNQLAQNGQNAIQMPQQQQPSFQLPNKQPSINSVFGNY